MSSRAYPSVRRDPDKKPKKRDVACPPRDIPEASESGYDRKVVCRICHVVMKDSEPMELEGRFYHGMGLNPKTGERRPRVEACPNAGMTFSTDSPSVEPYLRKGRRRALKRMNIRP